MAKTECSICTKEVDNLKERNGEMMCDPCYHDPENYVFGDEDDE